jgi:hypothetical protein
MKKNTMEKYTIKGTTFIVLFLVFIHLQLSSGIGFFPVVPNPVNKVVGQPPRNLQQSNTTLATSPGNTTSLMQKISGVKDQIITGFQATLSKLNELPPSEKDTFLMNAIFQPGRNLTTADIGDFLQVFSKLDQQSIDIIMDANNNFKKFREQYANMDDTNKKRTVSGLLRLLDNQDDFGLNKAEVYRDFANTFGDFGDMYKYLPPISRNQQQQAQRVVRKLQQQSNNGDSPYYFKSILENLQTFVSNIQKFLKIFDDEKMKTGMTTQKQKLNKKRIQLNNQKRLLRQKGLGDFVGRNVTDIINDFEQRNMNVTNSNQTRGLFDPSQSLMKRFREDPHFDVEFPVGGRHDFDGYKPLYNQPIPRNQTPSLNQTTLNSLREYFRANEQFQKRNKAYLGQHAQRIFINERGDSPVLKVLRGNVTDIERLARNVAGVRDPRRVMKTIFNQRNEGVIGYLAKLCNAIGEHGTTIQKKFLLQKDIDFGDKGNLMKFYDIMKLANNKRLYDEHQPIFFNTLPAGGFIDVFQKILEKFNVSAATRNKLNDDIIKFATDLEQKYNIILEDIKNMTLCYYKISELNKFIIYAQRQKEKYLSKSDITQEKKNQVVTEFNNNIQRGEQSMQGFIRDLFTFGDNLKKSYTDVVKLAQDDKGLLKIASSQEEKTNVSKAKEGMIEGVFNSLQSVVTKEEIPEPLERFLNRVNKMFVPSGTKFHLPGPPGQDDTAVKIQVLDDDIIVGQDGQTIKQKQFKQLQREFQKQLQNKSTFLKNLKDGQPTTNQQFLDDLLLGPGSPYENNK